MDKEIEWAELENPYLELKENDIFHLLDQLHWLIVHNFLDRYA